MSSANQLLTMLSKCSNINHSCYRWENMSEKKFETDFYTHTHTHSCLIQAYVCAHVRAHTIFKASLHLFNCSVSVFDVCGLLITEARCLSRLWRRIRLLTSRWHLSSVISHPLMFLLLPPDQRDGSAQRKFASFIFFINYPMAHVMWVLRERFIILFIIFLLLFALLSQ